MPRMTDKDCIELFEELSPETQADILHLADLAKRRIEMSRSKSDYILVYQSGIELIIKTMRWLVLHPAQLVKLGLVEVE